MINRTPWLLGLLLGVALSLPVPAHAGRGDREQEALANIGDRFAGAENGMPVSDVPWWESFGIEELDRIVAAGMDANPDVNAALAQFEQARFQAAQSYAVLLPTINASASLNGSPADGAFAGNPAFDGSPIGGDPTDLEGIVNWQGSLKLNASWQIDLWGRNTLLWLAQQQTALAQQENAAGQRLTISTTIAGSWFDVVFHQQRIAVIEEQIDIAESVLELTELRYERGDASALDVLQQRQQLASNRALLPQSRTLLRIAEQQLAILLARSPSDSPTVLVDAMPELSAAPAVGTPGDLIDRSPQVLAARAQLDAAERQLQAAWRVPLPNPTLTANYGPPFGYQSEGLFPPEGEDVDFTSFWGAGVSLTMPLFQGGSAANAVFAAREQANAAKYSLESAALGAVQQVEGALVQEEERALQREATEAQRDAAQAAYETAAEQYGAGLVNFLNVQSAQQTLLQAELSALQAHRDQLSARINLYAALGAATGQGDSR